MKRSRITQQSAQQSTLGLIAWLNDTRVALPLKGVECRFEVTGAIACVELDQIFHQNANRPLDCTYTFPLPAGAAVYRCELHVNGRVIRAKVEEKEAARKIYREQTAAGHRAALVESERANLFTLSLGNVQPEDVIVVRFAWFQSLDRAGDGLRLLVPTCPGVRYIPGEPLLRALSGRGTVDDTDQVPDASRITPPRIDALHPDAAYFSIEGRLSSSDVESGSASSPSHPILVRENGEAVTVELSRRGAISDRDFVLAWQEPKARQLAPQAWRWSEGEETYALVQLRAPEGVKVADGFPQDFYFLVDRSGSMAGAKWQRTCEALQAFVGLLGAEDRVWITLFESTYRDFAEAPLPTPRVLADQGFRRMEALGVAGGTELQPAALHVLTRISKHSADRRASVVLITDGQVGNEGEIVRAFRQAPDVRVHTFGIDTAVNDAFLQALARQQRGGCWLQTPDDDIAGTIAALGDRLRRPVITDLSARGSWKAGRETWPDLHAREVVTVALRGAAATSLEITGRFPDGREHCFAVDLGTMGSEAVKLLWAQERIAALLAADRQPEAIALARQHNLICEGAAFIAWDEAEQVQIAEEEIVQPAMEQFYDSIRGKTCFKTLAPMETLLASPDVVGRTSREYQPARTIPNLVNTMRAAYRRARAIPNLVNAVRDAFRQAGVAKSTARGFVTWARSGNGDAAKQWRLNALLKAADLITQVRNPCYAPLLWPILDTRIQQALNGSAGALLQWADDLAPHFHQLAAVSRTLLDMAVPKEVIYHLLSWIFVSGTIEEERRAKLEAFTNTVVRRHSSADERQLWTFLAAAMGSNAEVHALAVRWVERWAATDLTPGLAPK